MNEGEKKRDLIIEMATRRFIHYGIQKTTMNEIAEDIAVTQSSLYYYFPDKNTLLVAVMKRILEDYNIQLDKSIGQARSLADGFEILVDSRMEFTKRFFMLQFTEAAAQNVLYGACNELMDKARKAEINSVSGMIRKLSKGKAEASDTAMLYLDSITGLTMWALSPGKGSMLPGEIDFEIIINRMKALNSIFIKALQ